MEIDVLNSWKNAIIKKKWELGLGSLKMLSKPELDKITIYLYNFFPERFFQIALKEFHDKRQKNWMFAILATNKMTSIFQIIEIIRSLEFYESLEDKTPYQLFKKNGEFNVSGFRDIIFELFVIKLFQLNGLNIQLGEKYKNKKGSKKPLDAFFEFNQNGYIVECTKLYNTQLQNIKALSWKIEKKFLKIGVERTIHPDQLFSAYIGFKTSIGESRIVNKAEEDFSKLLKKYFHDLKKNEIELPTKFASENYDIVIEPSFLKSYEQIKHEAKKLYKNHLTIGLVAEKVIEGEVQARFDMIVERRNITNFIAKKLKNKFDQHNDSSLKKIVVVEIENTELNNEYGKSLPLVENDFAKLKIAKLTDENKSILIIIKNVFDLGMNYKFGFISHNSFDNDLSKILNRLKMEEFGT